MMSDNEVVEVGIITVVDFCALIAHDESAYASYVLTVIKSHQKMPFDSSAPPQFAVVLGKHVDVERDGDAVISAEAGNGFSPPRGVLVEFNTLSEDDRIRSESGLAWTAKKINAFCIVRTFIVCIGAKEQLGVMVVFDHRAFGIMAFMAPVRGTAIGEFARLDKKDVSQFESLLPQTSAN